MTPRSPSNSSSLSTLPPSPPSQPPQISASTVYQQSSTPRRNNSSSLPKSSPLNQPRTAPADEHHFLHSHSEGARGPAVQPPRPHHATAREAKGSQTQGVEAREAQLLPSNGSHQLSLPSPISHPTRIVSKVSEHAPIRQGNRKRPRPSSSSPSDSSGEANRSFRQTPSPLRATPQILTRKTPKAKRPRTDLNVARIQPISNSHSRAALLSLRELPVPTRVTERYITALHVLDQLYRNRLPFAAHVDRVAHDLVVDPAELRRVHALALISHLTDQKPFQIERYRFRKILAGHRDQNRSRRDLSYRKDSVVLSANRRLKAHRMRGVSIRDARETLSSAGWAHVAKKRRAINVLNGEESITQMREDGVFVDESDLSSLYDGENDTAEDVPSLENCNWFRAVRELSDAEGVTDEEVGRISGMVQAFAAKLSQIPSAVRVEDIDIVLDEREDSDPIGGEDTNGAGYNRPERFAYFMTIYRTESLQLQANPIHLRDIARCRRQLRLEFHSKVLERTGLSLHPIVERLLLCSYYSMSELAEHGNQFLCLGKLMSAQDRERLLKGIKESQVDALASQMKVRKRETAATLIKFFHSARRSLRASYADVQSHLQDHDQTKEALACLHGTFSNRESLKDENGSAIFVQRAVKDRFGDVSRARAASFVEVVGLWVRSSKSKHSGKGSETLTTDEKLAAYQRMHEERTQHDRISWGEYEASWGLFRLICHRTRIVDPVEATIRIIDQGKKGPEVLKWLSLETVEGICVRAGINLDDALTLKRFASAFVPSGCD